VDQNRDDPLARRIHALESRVAHLESLLAPQPAELSAEPQLHSHARRMEPPPQSPPPVAPPFAAPAASPNTPRSAPTATQPLAAPVPQNRAAAFQRISSLVQPRGDRAAIDWERAIGMRWFAAVGAVVVVIGVGLFLKLAYEQGWLDLLPPVAKCLLGAAFGALLLAAGEVIRRRVGSLASVGPSAAGLGALYAAAYASHGIYQLLVAPAAFILLALVSGLGFVVAARCGIALLAILALLGGYINPLIIGGSASPWVMPAYLLALLVTGLALSARRPRPFRALRPLVWWGTVLLGSLWIFTEGLDAPSPALLFIALVWAAVHVELSISARPAPGLEDARDDEDFEIRKFPELSWPRARFIATSFSTTLWSAAAAILTIRLGTALQDWLAPAAGAAVTIILASILAGHLRVLRDVPRSDAQRLGAALATQAGALLLAALALGMSGWTETLAWLGLGAAAIAAGRWVRSRGLDVYGLIVLSVGALRLISVDNPVAAVQPWAHDLGGILITRWTLLMLGGAGAWGLAAWLLRAFRPDDPGASWWFQASQVALIVGTLLLHGSVLNPAADGGSIALVWCVLALGAAALSIVTAYAGLTITAGIILLSASLWILLRQSGDQISPDAYGHFAGLVFSRWMLLMFAAAAAWLAYAALLPRTRVTSQLPEHQRRESARIPVGLGLALAYLAILHIDAAAPAVSLVWLAMSLVLVLVHPRLPRLALDLYGIAGLAAAAAAWFKAYPLEWLQRDSLPILHPGLAIALLLAAAGAASAWWLRRRTPTHPAVLPVLTTAAVVLVFIATSLEIARTAGILADDTTVRKAAVSIWWGFFGAALIASGFRRRITLARHTGLALIAIATAKAVFIDLADVPQIWRVVSFLGLGLLMLAVAVAYARLTARLKPS
jgi:uncharacterized membrane protein